MLFHAFNLLFAFSKGRVQTRAVCWLQSVNFERYYPYVYDISRFGNPLKGTVPWVTLAFEIYRINTLEKYVSKGNKHTEYSYLQATLSINYTMVIKGYGSPIPCRFHSNGLRREPT